MITGAQIRMGRGYLKWSVKDLHEKSGVGVSTIQRMEEVDDVPNAHGRNLDIIKKTLEAEGIRFIGDKEASLDGGPGVRLKVSGD